MPVITSDVVMLSVSVAVSARRFAATWASSLSDISGSHSMVAPSVLASTLSSSARRASSAAEVLASTGNCASRK